MNIWLTNNVIIITMNNCRHGTNLQQTNEFYYSLHTYPINFVLGYCIAAAPDPARDYWCTNHTIETQACVLPHPYTATATPMHRVMSLPCSLMETL